MTKPIKDRATEEFTVRLTESDARIVNTVAAYSGIAARALMRAAVKEKILEWAEQYGIQRPPEYGLVRGKEAPKRT